jgi:hypothetical protein
MVNLICAIWLAYKTSDRSVRRIGDGRCLRGTQGIGNSITPAAGVRRSTGHQERALIARLLPPSAGRWADRATREFLGALPRRSWTAISGTGIREA